MDSSLTSYLEQIWQSDPLRPYYNLNGLTDIILTCDVDWAPDFAVEEVINLTAEHGCKITIFATHKSKVLLNAPNHVEVGLHPDFTRVHSITSFCDKIKQLKEYYPDSVGMRSHRNFFGQNISDCAKKCGLKYDVSTFLWNEPFCQVHRDYNGLAKFSYVWEDGIHLDMNFPFNWDKVNLHTPGIKIINVHPILMYLNSDTEEHRRSVTRRYKDLTIATKSEIDPDVNHSQGIKNVWLELLKLIQVKQIRTHNLTELAMKQIQTQDLTELVR